MRKNAGWVFLLGMFMLSCVFWGFESQTAFAAPAKVYKWKYVQWRIAAELGMAGYKDSFEKRLPAMSNGRLQIKMYWAGDLVKSAEALDAVIAGIADDLHHLAAIGRHVPRPPAQMAGDSESHRLSPLRFRARRGRPATRP